MIKIGLKKVSFFSIAVFAVTSLVCFALIFSAESTVKGQTNEKQGSHQTEEPKTIGDFVKKVTENLKSSNNTKQETKPTSPTPTSSSNMQTFTLGTSNSPNNSANSTQSNQGAANQNQNTTNTSPTPSSTPMTYSSPSPTPKTLPSPSPTFLPTPSPTPSPQTGSIDIMAVMHMGHKDYFVNQARVRVKDNVSGELLVSGLTNSDGRLRLDNIPANRKIDVILLQPDGGATEYCGDKWTGIIAPGSLVSAGGRIRDQGSTPCEHP